MKYKDYDIENFITDEFFIQWIKKPNENNSHFWEKWIDQHPEKRAIVNEAAELIRSVKYKGSPEFTDKMYIETFEQILRADNSFPPANPARTVKSTSDPKGNFFLVFPIRKIAASLLLLFCFWVQFEAFRYIPEQAPIPEVAMIKRTNPSGQKSTIDLPDGSRIHLNANSEIEFPRGFSKEVRLISLKGEAFFEVEKEIRPFIVETGNTKIQVLGTSFNVNKEENGSLYVALVTGKVIVRTDNGSRMTLDPNEMLGFEEGVTFHKKGFDPMDIIGWKDNYLVFKRTGLTEVKKKLEQWYGVKIELKGDFDEKWTYSGVYKDEMLQNVLRGICMTSGFTYSIQKKNITITKPK